MTNHLSVFTHTFAPEQVNSGSVKEESRLEDYICLRVQDDANAAHQNMVIILRDFSVSDYSGPGGAKVPEVLALRLEKSLHCIDLALYKVPSGQMIAIL